MKYKLFLAILTLLVIFCQPINAEVTTTAHITVADKYLAFGSGIALTEETVLQSDISFGFENGVYLLVWGSTTFGESDIDGVRKDGSLDFGTEFDLGTGWAGKIAGFNVDVGMTYFDEPSVGSFGAEDVVYTHLRVGVGFDKFSLAFVFENYWTLPGSSFGSCNIAGFEASKLIKLSDSLSLNSMLGALYDDGGFGVPPGILIRGSVTLSYQLSKSCSLDGGGRFYLPTVGGDYRESDVMWWLGLTKKF